MVRNKIVLLPEGIEAPRFITQLIQVKDRQSGFTPYHSGQSRLATIRRTDDTNPWSKIRKARQASASQVRNIDRYKLAGNSFCPMRPSIRAAAEAQFILPVIPRLFLIMHDDRIRGTEDFCGTAVTVTPI
ncbi:hypothetical protein AA102526_0872 [Asaia lannensis NBRC 102526]|nr:hypothetical protein AA102526_0872 [Asaia lannensis NBRC 102526]